MSATWSDARPVAATSVVKGAPRCKARHMGTYQCSGSTLHAPGKHYANFPDFDGNLVVVEWTTEPPNEGGVNEGTDRLGVRGATEAQCSTAGGDSLEVAPTAPEAASVAEEGTTGRPLRPASTRARAS